MKNLRIGSERFTGWLQVYPCPVIRGRDFLLEVTVMSKYAPLWEYVQKSEKSSLILTFEEIQKITGFPIDHSFLTYKKELTEYGYQVGKISMKEKTVLFNKISND